MNNRILGLAIASLCAISGSLLAQQATPPAAPAAGAAPAAAADTVAPIAAGRGRASPHETINARIGAGGYNAPMVTITYGRPYAKAPANARNAGEVRKVWGALVPWNQVWRVGSDEATTLITPVALNIGGYDLAPGAYSLFMYPVENGPSKLIINKKIGQWGVPYDEAAEKANELARIDMKKDTISAPVDQLTLAITPTPNSTPPGGVIKVQWETTQYSVPFSLKQ